MKLDIYQIDAFTDRLFAGNPAAVCPLQYWLDDDLLQMIAAENNLAETAFFVPLKAGYHIRWFTPTVEVDLCGHATLASSFVIFNHLRPDLQSIEFKSRSGLLEVYRSGSSITLDFPANVPAPTENRDIIEKSLGTRYSQLLSAKDMYLAVYESEQQVADLTPDFAGLRKIDRGGVICTAPGKDCDFVSRFFAPNVGIDEDPVTGAAHCVLTPYWVERLGKTTLSARQISPRGGKLSCTLKAGRVHLSGHAVQYLHGQIDI